MMTKKALQELMQYLPEKYLEETTAFRVAHTVPLKSAGRAKPAKQYAEHSGFWLRIAAPLSAVACLAAVCGLVWWVNGSGDGLTVESHMQEIDEQQPAATQSSTAPFEAHTETTAEQAAENDTTTQPPKGGKPVQTGTGKTQNVLQVAEQTQSGGGSQAAGSAKTTRQTNQTTAQPTTTTAAAEPALPYDPDIVAQYRLGDVNMDGLVDMHDGQLLLIEYRTVVLDGGESTLTPEQIYLGDIVTDNIYPEVIGGIPQNGELELVETDYPISYVDTFVLMTYYVQCWVSYEIPLYPVEEYVKRGAPLSEEWELYYAPAIKMSGELDADTTEESVYFPQFGTLPVWVAGEKNWRLSKYNYYNGYEFYGADPPYCYLYATYYCEEDGSKCRIQFNLYPDGRAVSRLEEFAENDERFVVLQSDDNKTVLLKFYEDYKNVIHYWDRWEHCDLCWADGNWYTVCDGFTSEEEMYLFAEQFVNICTLE